MTRILLADDHRIFLDGLSALLATEADLQVCATAINGGQVMVQLAEHEPDVAILDIDMPGLTGLEATERIRAEHSDTKVLILSMHNEHRFIQSAIEAGANGYLLKNASKEEFCRAIRTVATGGTYFSQQVTEIIVNGLRNPASDGQARQVDLSARELEVLRLIAKEFTTPEIAEALFISEHTVKSHRKNLLSKLQVKNTAGLVMFAVEHDLLE